MPADLVEAIHDAVLYLGELPGSALNKSLEGASRRVENRLHYDLIGAVFDLAAGYAMAISQGHCFNDANQRTAFRCHDLVRVLNGVPNAIAALDIGLFIIRAVQGQLDEGELAHWLRQRV